MECFKHEAEARFDATHRRPMNEWLQARSDSAKQWQQLAREALEFVGT